MSEQPKTRAARIAIFLRISVPRKTGGRRFNWWNPLSYLFLFAFLIVYALAGVWFGIDYWLKEAVKVLGLK